MAQKFHGLGTNSEGYKKTAKIRLQKEALLRDILKQVRDTGAAYEELDQILDIGCGKQEYFLQLWDGVNTNITGIDTEIGDLSTEVLPENRSLKKIDFFDFIPEKNSPQKFNLIHASSALTWMMSPRGNVDDVPLKFWKKIENLLEGDGIFAAYHPGDIDYFPDYNKIIIHCLVKIGSKINSQEAYFAEREKYVSPQKIKEIKDKCSQAGLAVRFLANSLEWIPVKEDDYFAYWESGGRGWLESTLESENKKYENFVEIFKSAIIDKDLLEKLGVTTFTKNDGRYFLLPACFQYLVAKKKANPEVAVKIAYIDWKATTNSIATHAHSRMLKRNEGNEHVSQAFETLTKNLYSNSEPTYIALINALSDAASKEDEKNNNLGKFAENREWQKDWISKSTDLQIKKLTIAISNYASYTSGITPVGVVTYSTDVRENAIKQLMHDFDTLPQDGSMLKYVFCWPNSWLSEIKWSQNHETTKNKIGIECFDYSDNDDHWPCLFFQSDLALEIIKTMCVSATETNQPTSYLEPLKYFDWQTRFTAPKPQSFILATTLIKGVGYEVIGLKSIFTMIEKTSDDFDAASEAIKDQLTLDVLLSLGAGEMARELVKSRAILEEEKAELKRSEQMLLKLQRPLDVLTEAFDSVRAEAQEMQSILNDPEVALFATHKTLTELFIHGREIRVSDTIRLKMRHSGWSEGGDEARIAYAYAICRIFGCNTGLAHCQHTDALEATAQQLIEKIERDGVHSELLGTVAELVLPDTDPASERNVSQLRASLTLLPKEGDSQIGAIRKGEALDLWLKPVIFTPFKSFGSGWPKIAFKLAFYGKRFKRNLDSKDIRYDERTRTRQINNLDVHAAHTPFPQSAILDFIINFCALKDPKRTGDYWPKLSFETSKDHIEVHLHYKGSSGKDKQPYWNNYSEEPETQLPQFLKHAVKYAGTLGNCGDFLNVFGSLIKKGLGLATGSPDKGEWGLIDARLPASQMLIMGRYGQTPEQGDHNKFDRYFEVYQIHTDANEEHYGKVILRWANSLAIINGAENSDQTQSKIAPVITVEDVVSSSVNSSSQNDSVKIKVAIIDHAADQTKFKEQLVTKLGVEVEWLIEKNWSDSQVLFLHHTTPHEIGREFLASDEGKKVILLSREPDELTTKKLRFEEQYRNRVFIAQDINNVRLGTDVIKERILNILNCKLQ